MLAIKVDIRGMDAVQKNLARISDELKRGKAIGAALNKTGQKAKAEVNRAIVQRYAIKAGEVRNSVYLRSARAKANDLQAVIEIFGSPSKRGRSMNLVRFLAAVQAAGRAHKTRGARGNRKALAALGAQLGFQITRSGGLKQIEGAFLGNKGRTVFQRTGPGRLPIAPVQVIGVSQMFSSRAIRTRVMAKINADLPVEVRRAVEMILARSAR
jgi:hypothetical protein